MDTSTSSVFTDEEVSHHILSVISNAKEYVVFVTPYIQMWGHVKNAVELATRRGVEVTFLVRDDQQVVNGDDVRWLRAHRVDVRSVERLHAKIYLNETTTIVSSMNLVESSSKNSLEIGTLVNNQEEQAIRQYIDSTLMKLAKPFGQPSRTRTTVKTGTSSSVWDIPRQPTRPKAPEMSPSKPRASKRAGYCIRCGTGKALDVNKPLCDDCYDSWAVYSNWEYPEHYCHWCGKPSGSNYARPLCETCYSTQHH